MASKTGFDKYFARKMKSAEFAAAYSEARSAIDTTDQIVRAMDAARVELGMSKAELARRIGAKPESIRRLFTAGTANPTLNTVAQIADVLGMRLDLVPASVKRSGASATGTRSRAASHLRSRRSTVSSERASASR